jgi:hypothetical protein
MGSNSELFGPSLSPDNLKLFLKDSKVFFFEIVRYVERDCNISVILKMYCDILRNIDLCTLR